MSLYEFLDQNGYRLIVQANDERTATEAAAEYTAEQRRLQDERDAWFKRYERRRRAIPQPDGKDEIRGAAYAVASDKLWKEMSEASPIPPGSTGPTEVGEPRLIHSPIVIEPCFE